MSIPSARPSAPCNLAGIIPQEGETFTCHHPGLPVTRDKGRSERMPVLQLYPYEGTAGQATPSSENPTE